MRDVDRQTNILIFVSIWPFLSYIKGLGNRWRDNVTPSGRKSKIAELSSYDKSTFQKTTQFFSYWAYQV